MSEALDSTGDEWVARVLGLDLARARGKVAAPQSRFGLKALITGIASRGRRPPANWEAAATTPTTEASETAPVTAATATPPVTWVAATTRTTAPSSPTMPPPTATAPLATPMIGANRPPLTLSSRTYVKLPAPRSRNTLGVGESVALTASLSDGQWTTTAGELSATTGTKVTLRAPRTAGTATVTVTAGNQAASISFNVIAPSSLRMRFDRGWHKVLNPPWPHAGMRCQPFIGPDTANFRNVEVVEEDVEAVASGCWAVWHGRGHGPETEYIPASSTVKSGWGTALPILDNVDSGGLATNPRPTDWTGQLTFDIPIRWRCGSATGLIAVVRHLTQTDAAGTTTISKGGASYTAPMT